MTSFCSQFVRFYSNFTETSFQFISTASASTISSLLTLFPKCFSSFLHSTCSLSVSYIYLALEEVYLPLSALVSKYTTLLHPARLDSSPHTGLSPSLAVRSWTLLRRSQLGQLLQITIRQSLIGDFQCGLFPLPSPVLRESLLVSFPPLNDMLKFSGWSYFISDAVKI